MVASRLGRLFDALERHRPHDHVPRILAEIREELTGDARTIRTRVADLVQEVAEGSGATWYVFGLVDGDPFPVDWVLRGAPDIILSRPAAEKLPWPGGDPRMPDPRWMNRFVLVRSVVPDEVLEQTKFYARCIEPIKVTDQIRMMVYHGGRHVGWIGALRKTTEPRFGRREQRRLRALAPLVTHALVHADAVSRAESATESADLVIDARGRVELASETARSLLAHPDSGRILETWARLADTGRDPWRAFQGNAVRWARLHGPQGTRYLLHVEPAPSVVVHEAHALTHTERRIARWAADGATVRDIAQMADVAEATVRTHLRKIYATLHVANRAELARAIADMPSFEPPPPQSSVAAE